MTGPSQIRGPEGSQPVTHTSTQSVQSNNAVTPAKLNQAQGKLKNLKGTATKIKVDTGASVEGKSISQLNGMLEENLAKQTDLRSENSALAQEGKYLEGQISKLKTEKATKEKSITTNEDAKKKAEADKTKQDGIISDNDGIIKTQDGLITQEKGNISDAETGIGSCKSAISDLAARLSGCSDDNERSSIASQRSSVSARLREFEGKKKTAEGNLKTAEDKKTEATNKRTAAQNESDRLGKLIPELNKSILADKESVKKLTDEIKSNTDNLNVNKQQLSENSSSLKGLSRSKSDIKKAIDRKRSLEKNAKERENYAYVPSYTPIGSTAGGVPSSYGNSNGPSITASQGDKSVNLSNSYKSSDPQKQQINDLLEAAAKKYGIPVDILKAVAWQESSWNPKALSYDAQHGKGVMQIDDRFHQFAKTQDVFDPVKNIEYGANYLRSLYDNAKSGNPGLKDEECWKMALKRYNGGSTYPGKILGIANKKPWESYVSGKPSDVVGEGGSAKGVIPLSQNNRVSCGQTSVAVTVNALTGKHLIDGDINRKYGFGLHGALEGETGMSWNCNTFNGNNSWSKIENSLKNGVPVIIGLGGPPFTRGRIGHIVTITKVAGNDVYYADSNGGVTRKTTKQAIEQDKGHSQGKFLFMASEQSQTAFAAKHKTRTA